MREWFIINWRSIGAIAVTTIGIYVSIIVLTQLFGKRSFSKMSGFDLAVTITLGSILANTITSKSVSLWEGMLALFLLFGLQSLLGFLRRYRKIEKKISNTPLLLMKEGKIIKRNLKKAQVSENELRGKLREANVTRRSQVKAVIFETTGNISVLTKKENLGHWILKDVEQ